MNTLRITRGAYPEETEQRIGQYLAAAEKESHPVKQSLVFALLCVLESIRYTRKDGQYLRWDYRSGRNVGKKKFDKGPILTFDEAITGKLTEIIFDLENNEDTYTLFQETPHYGDVHLYRGSCLNILPTLPPQNLPPLSPLLRTAIVTIIPECMPWNMPYSEVASPHIKTILHRVMISSLLLEAHIMTNAANLTSEKQLLSLCEWLTQI